MTNKKPMYQFTKDYLDCIAQAWLYTAKHNNSVIHADDVLLGVYQFTRSHDFHAIFWQFFGWKTPTIIESYGKKHYGVNKPNIDDKKLKLKLSGFLKEQFDGFKKDGISTLNFLVLFYSAVDTISDEMAEFFEEQWVDLDKAQEKIMKVIKLIDTIDIEPIEFFNTLYSMVDTLNLDIEQMDMFIDMGTITWDDLDVEDIIKQSTGWWVDTTPPGDQKSDITKNEEDDKKMTIEYFWTDITQEAKDGELDPVIGRGKEIDQMIYTLLRKTKNNPMLIGEAWVWKTAIVEWLAQKIADDDVPDKLKNKRIMMVDIWSLVAGTKYRGEFEARLKAIIEEATDPMNNIIMFIDEAHTIIGAWNAEWSADAANMLKPLLARGKLQLIAATTYDEYQKHIEKDPALKRRFQELNVNEPTESDALEILQWIKEKFEEFHGVTITNQSIVKAVRYSVRYIMNKHLPDKAIDIIDEACARVSTLQSKLEANNDYLKLQKRITGLEGKIQKAIEKQDYFKAAEYKEQEEKLKKELKWMRQQNALPKHLRPKITQQHIGEVLADKMWIPLSQITESEVEKLSWLKDHLQTYVLWQDEAVTEVVKAIQRNRLSAVDRNRPMGSFLFLWASWVGKTYIAKLIASEYFNDEKALIRVDMSEFMEKHSVSKLIGSAPGYVGYDEWWMLTEQVRRKPYSVVLFDEIEKASRDVLNVLLQILDEWHLKDNKWRMIDFKNTVIILTSNIWSDEFGKKQATIGFADGSEWEKEDKKFQEAKERILKRVKDHLAPELINRLSGQVVFKSLSKDLLAEIFKKDLDAFYAERRKTYADITLPRFTKKKIKSVIDEIYDPAYWARPIQRYIEKELEPKLIQQVIKEWLEQTIVDDDDDGSTEKQPDSKKSDSKESTK